MNTRRSRPQRQSPHSFLQQVDALPTDDEQDRQELIEATAVGPQTIDCGHRHGVEILLAALEGEGQGADGVREQLDLGDQGSCAGVQQEHAGIDPGFSSAQSGRKSVAPAVVQQPGRQVLGEHRQPRQAAVHRLRRVPQHRRIPVATGEELVALARVVRDQQRVTGRRVRLAGDVLPGPFQFAQDDADLVRHRPDRG